MFTAGRGRRVAFGAVVVGAAIALSGCSSSDPLANGGSGDSGEDSGATLVVGSAAFPENEILAEVYSQALENAGFTVDRQFNIGQREVYLDEIESGAIDVFPEYVGSLLQVLNPDATSGDTDAVYTELKSVLPDGLTALEPSAAADGNSWTVTQAFADKYDLTDIASLKNVTEPMTPGGNSELPTRPYGPDAIAAKYGLSFAGFTPIEDSGGPLTVKALTDNSIQLANVYTASPSIKADKLIALEDPDGIFFPDNIVPIISSKVDADAQAVLDSISSTMTTDQLIDMNSANSVDQKSAEVVAKDWLTENDLLK
ncbi:MAG: glycine/betaine transporter [Glaciihabitans sp.]|nr:glycine/betaine transporter [Glaciihabitans sp.]